MIDKELIVACYRAILNRSPENDGVIEDKLERLATAEALIREFLECDEYQQQIKLALDSNYASAGHVDSLFSPRPIEPRTIEFDVSDADLLAAFRLRKWSTRNITSP